MLKIRTESSSQREPRGLLGAILGDVHFWVPVIVLVGGLAVLRWVS